MAVIARDFDKAKRRRLNDLGYRGEDRRLPFTEKARAEAAAANVIGGGLRQEEFAELASELIDAAASGRPTKIWKLLRRRAREIRRAQAEAATPDVQVWDGSLPAPETLLSPKRDRSVIDAIERALVLQDRHCFVQHVRDLTPDQAAAIVALDPKAIQAAFARAPYDRRWVVALVATAWKHRAIAVAHGRMAALARATRSSASVITGAPEWPSSGYLFLQTITGPALVLQKLSALAPQAGYAGLDDATLLERAVKDHLLPQAAGAVLLKMAYEVRGRISIDANTGMAINVLNCVRHCANGARSAAMLVKGDMKRDGLDQEEPIERSLGLTAGEAAAFLAEQLQLACQQIDGWAVDILATGRLGPVRIEPASLKVVGHLANILSHEAQPGRYSSGKRGSRDARIHDPLDPQHFPMRGAVASMRGKVEAAAFRARLIRSFGVDARGLLG